MQKDKKDEKMIYIFFKKRKAFEAKKEKQNKTKTKNAKMG